MLVQIASLAAGLLALQAAPSPVAPGVAVFHDACLTSTPVARSDLAAMAVNKGWTQVHPAVPADQAWRDVYQASGTVVHLDQHKITDSNKGELICVVLVGPAASGWKDQISGLLVNGAPIGPPGTYDTNVYQLPPELELTVWDLPDGSRIHALREPDNTLELSVNYPTGR